MKRSQRINDMMIYASRKHQFNLKDLMNHYQISKSTALRDVKTLESLGLALYSEQGRHGKYSVINKGFLSPITFSIDEVSVLYFAMLTLENYDMCPFNIDLNQLKEKFEAKIPQRHLLKILEIDKILQPEIRKSLNSSVLRKILDILLTNKEKNFHLKIRNNGEENFYQVRFIRIFTKSGDWYTEVINLQTQQHQKLSCSQITFLD